MTAPSALSEEIARTLYKSRGQFDDATVDLHFNWFYDPSADQSAETRVAIAHCYRDADALLSRLPALSLLSLLPAQAVGEGVNAAIAAEREVCAKIADERADALSFSGGANTTMSIPCRRIASDIRARAALPSPPAEPSGEMVEAACAEAREAGRRENAAWAERDQYMQSNVKLAAAVAKLRTALDALRPFPLIVEPVAAALIAEADDALRSRPAALSSEGEKP